MKHAAAAFPRRKNSPQSPHSRNAPRCAIAPRQPRLARGRSMNLKLRKYYVGLVDGCWSIRSAKSEPDRDQFDHIDFHAALALLLGTHRKASLAMADTKQSKLLGVMLNRTPAHVGSHWGTADGKWHTVITARPLPPQEPPTPEEIRKAQMI